MPFSEWLRRRYYQFIRRGLYIACSEKYALLEGRSRSLESVAALSVACGFARRAQIAEGNEADLAAAVVNQPVAIGIDASHVSFQFYRSGIYDDSACSSTDIDHAVLLVSTSCVDVPGAHMAVYAGWL